jgi:predicted ester cyclase
MVDLEKTVRKIYKAMTEGDLEFLDKIFDENMKYIGASNTTHSKEVIMRELPYNKAAFPDESFNLTRITTQDNVAVAEYTWTATHEGEYRGYPATFNKVELPVVDILTFKNGKVIEFKDVFNWKIYEKLYLPKAKK